MSNVNKTKEMKKATNMTITTIPFVYKEVNQNNLLGVQFLLLSLCSKSMKKKTKQNKNKNKNKNKKTWVGCA